MSFLRAGFRFIADAVLVISLIAGVAFLATHHRETTHCKIEIEGKICDFKWVANK